MIITRKIELWVIGSEEEKRNSYKHLRDLNEKVFRNANKIVTSQLSNFTFKEQKIIKTNFERNKIWSKLQKEKDKELKKGLENDLILKKKEIQELKKIASEELETILGTSQQNSTYQLISEDFEGFSSIASSLNNLIFSYLKKEINDVISGKKSLRTYKKGLPIPFLKNNLKFSKINNDIILSWLNNVTFKINFGKDKSNNKVIIDNCIDGNYKICDSSIQLKNNKVFLLLVVDIPVKVKELNKNISVGVDLGIAIPAYCALSDGSDRLAIGSKDDFLRIRTRFQAIKRQKQKSLSLTNGGHGRKHKLKALESLQDKEKNWVKTYNHKLTSDIINFAVKNNASVIKLELLEGFGKDGKKDFILKNWSYYQIQQMLIYKAKRYGIEVFYVDPYHTSQICSCCGHFEEGQREKQNIFKCKNIKCDNFNEEINADYNAALNISKSINFVDKKEDCEYYKLNNKKEELFC